jgi:lipopolysaccharide biosynthesis glycosyltransferase
LKGTLLVTLADRNFLAQAKQLFSGAYWNAGWKGDYMLLACEVPEAELKWFREKGILVKEVKPFSDSDSRNETLRYPATVTCKLTLFCEEFKRWSTVVFVDADCIIRYPLDSLAKSKSFAAARDWLDTALMEYQAKRPERMHESEYFQQLNGYSLTATAFNTGVFAFKTEIINHTTQAELQRIFQKYGDLARFGEQLWMNLFFYKKWKRLPMEYNLFASYLHAKRGLPKSQVDGVILHFPRYGNEEGFRCWDPGNPFYDEWKRNLERAELIDLKHIPKAKSKWPGLKHLLFQRWQLRLALRGDYLKFYRNRMAVRSRLRKVISCVRQGTFN